jgi:hypothetical protein
MYYFKKQFYVHIAISCIQLLSFFIYYNININVLSYIYFIIQINHPL